MISIIIFSKNRACQLDLLLRSLEKNFKDISTDIKVLYKATNDNFKNGYNKLFNRFPKTMFYEEVNFYTDTLFMLNQSKDLICFFVDDNIVYRKPKLRSIHIEYLFDNIENFGCFSFRLGLNTIIQDPYTNTKVNPMPLMEYFNTNNTDMFCCWNWTTLPMNNFSYPFSVDGHIYRTELIKNSLDYEFDTPNALEGRFNMKKIPKVMCCLEQSSVVNNPLNLVGSSNNKAGEYYEHTLEEMNEQYITGKQIDLNSLCKNKIVGCHQEMDIKYE